MNNWHARTSKGGYFIYNGRIRLSVSTVNRTCELTWHPSVSTENIRLGPVLTDRESVPIASCSPVSPFLRFVVTEPNVTKSNEIPTYGRVSRWSIPRVRRYGLLYLRTVEYDQWLWPSACYGGHFVAQFIINTVTYMFTRLSGTVNFADLHSGSGNLCVWPVYRQLHSNVLSATLTVGNNTIPLIVRVLYWRLLTKLIRKLLIEEKYPITLKNV